MRGYRNKHKILKIYILGIILVSLFLISSSEIFAGEPKPYYYNPSVPVEQDLVQYRNTTMSLFTGAAIYSYSIDVPPGTNGLKPGIGLVYNSQSTKQSGMLGNAWSLTQSYIQRDVNYTRGNVSDDEFKLVFEGATYDLIYVASESRYHTKIESYMYVENKSGGDNEKNSYWLVRTKDGTAYRFGYNNDSELVSNVTDFVVRWSLDLINDTHGNKIYYTYREDPYSNDAGVAYPHKIEYNNDKRRVIEFILESSDRPDKRMVYEQGNRIKISRRLEEIRVTADNNTVSKYVLGYETTDNNSMSFLINITQYGDDNTSSLPPIKFEYNEVTKGWTNDTSWKLPDDDYAMLVSSDLKDRGTRLVDINRDGLIDIVHGKELVGALERKTWINTGSGWENYSSWNLPSESNAMFIGNTGTDMGTRIIDLNNDGLPDIINGRDSGGVSRKSWTNTGSGWVANSTWYLPNDAAAMFADGNGVDLGTRLVDVNGDGLPDIIHGKFHDGSTTRKTWINTGSGWAEDTSWKLPDNELAMFVNSDGTIYGTRLVDVNGDGLSDLVHARYSGSTSRKTWINTGAGWVEDSSWEVPNDADAMFVDSNNADQGTRMFDVNGDGLIDIVHGEESGWHRRTWINTGTGWAEDVSWKLPYDWYAMFVSNNGYTHVRGCWFVAPCIRFCRALFETGHDRLYRTMCVRHRRLDYPPIRRHTFLRQNQ